MNEFYKILVMFHSGEKITHTRLLKIVQRRRTFCSPSYRVFSGRKGRYQEILQFVEEGRQPYFARCTPFRAYFQRRA